MDFTRDDMQFLRRALTLARRGLGRTSPNPAVGAVVVQQGRVVGEGYHQQAGGPHAEVHALRKAGDNARGATVYVSLEPCAHYAKTPPCTLAVLHAGVQRVVFCSLDPNPLVAGKGMQLLRDAGVSVAYGALAEQEAQLNEAWRYWLRTQRPFVTLKLAASLDGKIATRTGESRWITGEEARRDVHRLRHTQDAILSTATTVLCDDPRLDTRLPRGRDARRVVVDAALRTSPQAAVYRTADRPPLLVTLERNESRLQPFREQGVDVVTLPGEQGHVDLHALMQALGERNILSVMVEAGGAFSAALLHAGLVKKLRLYFAPMLIGGCDAPTFYSGEGVQHLSEALRLHNIRYTHIGNDIRLEGYCGVDSEK